MIIKDGDFQNPAVIQVLKTHLAGMHANSPSDSVYALDLCELQTPDINFWTVWEGDTIMGCGALKELSATCGEIKSMRTLTTHLRKGVAANMLEHILNVANQRGYKRVSLETGSGSTFEPAIRLYKKYGFVSGEPFGAYKNSEFNQFFHLELI